MKAAIFEGIGQMTVRDVPDPTLEPGSVIVKVKVCSICGTDLRIFRHGHRRINPPQIIGHEIAGEIVAVSPEITQYRTGDRVAITPRVSCGKCFYCRRGKSIHCLDGHTFGFQMPGGFAEYILIPNFAIRFGVIHPIATQLTFEEAALGEPLACCLRAQKAAQLGTGDTVVVIGGGPVGIMHCRLAKARKADQVILIEKDTTRLESIDLKAVDELIDPTRHDSEKTVAAYTEGNLADVVVVACSSTQAQEDSLALAGKGGRIDFFAGLPTEHPNISIDSNLLHYKEVSLRGTHSCLPADNREALDLLAHGKVKIGDITTHTFPLDAITEAFQFAESRQGMHVSIHP